LSGNKKGFSTLVDEDLAHQLKLYLTARNIPISKWLTQTIETTLQPQKQIDLAQNNLPDLASYSADKKDWMMRNLTNNEQIGMIKAGCEEWLHLIKLWNRGDLKQ
jgi:hypothetical protein